MKRLRWLAASLVVPAAATAAWAMWTAEVSPGSHGSAVAAEVGAGEQPSASADGSTVTVSWGPSTLSDGSPVTAYVLTRSAVPGGTATTGPGCSGLITGTTCTETVPDGTWSYTVTPAVGTHWRGPASAASDPVTVDTTGPAGGSATVVGLSGLYTSRATLSLRLDPGTDPRGIAPGSQLLRAEALLSGGTCGAFGIPVAVRTDPPAEATDAVPSGGRCYRYDYVVRDSLGNPTTLTSNAAAVDTTAPSTPGLTLAPGANAAVSGSTVYHRPGAAGSFKVTATSSDTGSGLASSSFPALGPGWALSTNGATATYTWSGTPAVPAVAQVTAVDRAGNTSAAGSFTVVADSTPPAGGSVSYVDGFTTVSRITVDLDRGVDAQSGTGSRRLERAQAPLTDGSCGAFGPFSLVVNGGDPPEPRLDPVEPGSCYQYRYLVNDRVGNQAVFTSAAVAKVLSSGYATNVRGTEGLSSYWRLGEPTMVFDSFTGSGSIGDRRPDTGAPWTRHVNVSGDAVLTAAGRVRRAAGASALSGAVHSSSIPQDQTDYTVEADLFFASALANDAAALLARLDPSSPTGYAGGYDQATQRWQLLSVKPIGGITKQVLAETAPEVLVPGRTYHVALDLQGARMRLLVDGVERLTAADPDNVIRIGTGGILLGFGGGLSATPTETTGMHLDNVRITPSARDSAGGPAGFYLGAPALGQPGAVPDDRNTAAGFDGANDEVRVTARMEQSMSVELWFNAAHGSGTGATWREAAPLFSTQHLGIGLTADGAVVAGEGDTTLRSAAIGDNAWHQVVLTRSEDRLRLFVDAVEVATGDATAAASESEVAVRLGGRGPGGAFTGLLDEVAVYTAALSPESVAAHHAVAVGAR